MKYCLSSRVSPSYLKMADEIKIEYKDRKSIIDAAKQYPNADIILSPSEEYDWEEMIRYNHYTNRRFIMIVPSLSMAAAAKEADIKFILNAEVTNMWDLKGIISLGAYGAYVGIPLFFQLEAAKDLPIKLRAVPTQAYNHSLPREDGIHGQWVRPEDVELYNDYIDVFEFEKCDKEREETLFRIYKIQKKWSSELSAVVSDLGTSAINRMIPPTLVRYRLNCGQKCEYGKSCRICNTQLQLTNLVTEDVIE